RQSTRAAHVAMHLLHAVRGPLAFEIVPLHYAGVAAALRQPGDIDRLDAVEHFDGDSRTDFGLAGWSAQFANEALGFAARFVGNLNAGRGQLLRPFAFELGNMTTFTAAGEAAGLVEKAELHRLIA